jgi:hypothetical protein
MSAEKPSDAQKPPAPPSGGPGYRTLTPAATPVSKPATARVAPKPPAADAGAAAKTPPIAPDAPKEESHPDPTRFGDWELKGRCIDF